MKLALLFATLTLAASAADVTGAWKAEFVGDPATWPKMVPNMVFELKADGDKLTGIAHMSNWPGTAPVSEGRIEGDRISFTAVGNSPWRASSPKGESSGFPKLMFTGTVKDNRIDIDLVWDSVMIYGPGGKPHEYKMRATRVEK